MHTTLTIHVIAGAIGIVSGFVALSAAKGAGLHRKSGIVFVFAMVAMSVLGAVIAAAGGGEASVIAGLLTAYLVITSLTTLRPPSVKSHRLDLGALLLAWAVGLASVALGIDAVSLGGVREGIPAPVHFMFAAVGILAGVSDIRVMRTGPLRGAPRLARHLWRMCFALYIASASFFLGQADHFPEAIQRMPALLAVPVVAPLLAMFYWLWRVRVRRRPAAAASLNATLESNEIR